MRPKLSLLIILLSFSNLFAQERNKIALIVAISNYPAASGWGELSSSNDVKLIKDALVRQGFKEQDIAVVTEKQATFIGMSNAFDKYLTQRAKPGDIAVFHYSGHGQQIEDDNGDEADGLDEALVPYDAPLKYRPGVNNHFRDDLLGQKLAQLRQKLGPTGNALVIIDACHSGTITRGVGRKRGTTEIYASPTFKVKKQGPQTFKDDAYNIINKTKDVAPMACFFASSPEECNQEAVLPDGTGVGSLSLAFSRALANADKSSTYRGLFDNIKIEMSALVSRQTPLAEGDLDYKLFGGQAVGKPSYYQVKKDDVSKRLTIPTGKIYGVFNNTTFKLYKADTRDTANAKPIATGVITNAGQYASDFKLDKNLSETETRAAWVYLDEINYGDLSVKVKLNIADQNLKKDIIAALPKIKQVSLVNDAADLFMQSGMNQYSADSLYLINAGEFVIWQTSKNLDKKKLYDTLAIKFGDYARSNYLRNLALTNPTYNITVEFVPVKCVAGCGSPATAEYEDDKVNNIKTKMDASGNISFKDGDKFRLNITNHSDQKILYYTILDIQPDNEINVMIPGLRDQPEDFRIMQEQTVKLKKIFTIGPPYGIDVLKVIASDVPLDLRNVFINRAARSRGMRGAPKNPFEKIMEGTFSAEGSKKRGSKEETIQPDAVNIMTLPFHITNK